MRVYRAFEAKHEATALTGEGARRFGGRWNSVGTPMVYTASTFALALLEIIVNASSGKIPSDMMYAPIEIPSDIVLDTLPVAKLPRNWHESPAPLGCQRAGDLWIRRGETVGLIVPSAVARIETNVLLNPSHGDFARLTIGNVEPMALDRRFLR